VAPVNARGKIEYTAEFVMLKPRDMAKASGVLRYDAPNRGNMLTLLNPAATPSDAVYLERGYVAKDPKVMGVGLAALRDMVSFLRDQAADADGRPNPLAGHITRMCWARATSQSGNAMKTFLHLGFNQSLGGGKVFDGLYAHTWPHGRQISCWACPAPSSGSCRARRC
jgi:hypothetical protein